jgi:hypothetical protein
VPGPTGSAAPLPEGPDGTGVKPTPRAWTWAALMHRAFAIDILAWGYCGGRLRLIATLHARCRHPEARRAPGPRPFGAESCSRPARAQRRLALIGRAEARAASLRPLAAWRRRSPPGLIRPVRLDAVAIQ